MLLPRSTIFEGVVVACKPLEISAQRTIPLAAAKGARASIKEGAQRVAGVRYLDKTKRE